MGMTWHLLVYKVPSEPSSARVAAWRKLKAHGAAALQQSVWLLPAGEKHGEFLADLCHDITAAGGAAYVFSVETAAESLSLVDLFQADRAAEYREVLDRGQAFLDEIAREEAAHKHTYAELAELEEEWEKLQQWVTKVHARDFFSAPAGETVAARLAMGREALTRFAATVYRVAGLQDDVAAHPPAEDGTAS